MPWQWNFSRKPAGTALGNKSSNQLKSLMLKGELWNKRNVCLVFQNDRIEYFIKRNRLLEFCRWNARLMRPNISTILNLKFLLLSCLRSGNRQTCTVDVNLVRSADFFLHGLTCLYKFENFIFRCWSSSATAVPWTPSSWTWPKAWLKNKLRTFADRYVSLNHF